MIHTKQIKRSITGEIPKRDIRFWRSLGYSVLFHVMLFGTISIEYLPLHETITPLVPTEVLIDGEPQESVLADAYEPHEDMLTKIASPSVSYRDVPFAKKILDTGLTSTVDAMQRERIVHASCGIYTTNTLTPKIYSPRMYPLSIVLSSNLEHIQILYDGSDLFREGTNAKRDVDHQKLHPITYTVRICPKTGTIASWTRTQDIPDTTLQLIADRVIQHIQFDITNITEDLRGSIQLLFTHSGKEIEHFLGAPL